MACPICKQHKFDLFKCRGCGAVEYCSKECQGKDLIEHEQLCGLVQYIPTYNTIVLLQNGDIEQKNMSINDMRKIWGAQWSDGYLLKVGSIGYRLEGNHLGQYIEDPNATIPEMYGNLTIRRDSLDFWDNESSIPMGPRNKILHPLCEIIEIIPNADINRISGFVG